MRFEYIKEKRWIRLLFFAFCAVVFLLAAFVIAHRDSFTTGIWFPTSTNSDEVIYNRQLVGVLKVGSPQGYFGYNESHAAIGTFSTWGPLVIWLYAIPGFLFGAGYNTMFWCNLFFAVLAWVVLAGRMNRKQQLAFAAVLLCLWIPLRQIFTATSEPLHFFLLACVVSGSLAAAKGSKKGEVAAVLACALDTMIRPYGVILFLFPIVCGWKNPKRGRRVAGMAALAVAATVLSLWSMNQLSAPYGEQSLDFAIFEKAAHLDILGAISYFFEKLHSACKILYNDYIRPTKWGGTEQYIADVTHGFLRVLALTAVTIGLCIYDIVKKRPIRCKLCGVVCALTVLFAILVLYDPVQLRRYAAFMCMILLMASAAENGAIVVACVPLALLLIYPSGFAHSDGLPAYDAAMDAQLQQVTTVLEESQAQFNQENATAWDHTLTFGYGDVYYGYLYAVPAGMGIEFDWNTYIADPEETIYSRYAMVNHGTDAEARLLADGWQEVISTEDLIVYERPDTQ